MWHPCMLTLLYVHMPAMPATVLMQQWKIDAAKGVRQDPEQYMLKSDTTDYLGGQHSWSTVGPSYSIHAL